MSSRNRLGSWQWIQKLWRTSTEGAEKEATIQADIPQSTLIINNVRLAHIDNALAEQLWTVECRGGKVGQVSLSDGSDVVPLPDAHACHQIDAKGSFLLPSLCHSHIHLDKCFILDRCKCEFGDFTEAMKVTARAKQEFRYDTDDLLRRGRRLIRESIECGVTSMRAHVEVDSIVGLSCLTTAVKLRNEFKTTCNVQIAVFAQEPLFDSPADTTPGSNYCVLKQALEDPEVEAIGSAPYVEPNAAQAKKNITLILELAARTGRHTDFHLDYNIGPDIEPLVWEVIREAKRIGGWISADGESYRGITIGHATRLQLFTPDQWQELKEAIGELPITLVGLPNSDMYMQGRGDTDKPLGPPRSTLRVPYIARKYDLHIAMSVNNIENAFTPQGSVDPLALCTLGVALFQSATPRDIRTLIRSVTLTSKRALGMAPSDLPQDLCPQKGDLADFVIMHETQTINQAVLNPSYDRTTIRGGVVVARRLTKSWVACSQPRATVKLILPWYRRVQWTYLLFPPLLLYRFLFSRDTNTIVLVTGANGFVGTWIVGDLLKGGYSVRAAVRNEGRGKHLLDIYKSYGDKLKLVAVGDISESGAFDDAVKDVDAIIHTASPVHLSADDPSELIDPAVGGVEGILKSALKNGSDSLKRIVITSSCAAIIGFSPTPVTVSEAVWNESPVKECEEKGRDASSLAKYSASKTLAEKAAWAFYEKHKPEIKWDISTINPPWVFGPVIHEVTTVDSLNSSSRIWYNAIVKEDFDGYSPLTTPGHGWVDVRDVATAHVRAMEVPSAGGERIIVSAGSWVWQDWLDVISTLSPNPYPSRTLPRGTPGICQRAVTFDTSKEKRILGIKFRTMEEMARDILADYERRGW